MTLVHDQHKLLRSICRASFYQFVLEFWEEVPGAGKFISNWHIEVFCEELQRLAERVFAGLPKEHDLAVNVSPGTSKSTIFSILFPAWLWTRMPSARVLTASHTDALALDLANKARQVIKSDKYRHLFPAIELREDQDTKGYYANTLGGDRLTCTVAGKSPTGFHGHLLLIDDPLDPKKVLSELEVKTARDFMTNVLPSRKVDKSVSVTVLIMQRLGLEDSTDVMLKEALKPGAAAVRHVCLPAELLRGDDGEFIVGDVKPPECIPHYLHNGGLMDPRRLGRQVLDEFKARGAHYFSTQFMQRPYALSGGMFKATYFLQRVKAAPYHGKRVRYWDRAASDAQTNPGACYTAGVLLCFAEQNWYVEHVVHGQWEPDERNKIMRATALADRARYGPEDEPVIWVEAEGGSSGRDAWKGVTRALAGFIVKEQNVSRLGKKEVRAEPWSCQCAAGNVYLVDNGESLGLGRATWDVQGFCDEHLAFPLGKFKDQVDSAAGAFSILVQNARMPVLRTLSLGKLKPGALRIVVCSRDDLAIIVTDHRALLVSLQDPAVGEEVGHVDYNSSARAFMNKETPHEKLNKDQSDSTSAGGGVLPPHGLHNLLGGLVLTFADLQPEDYQQDWDQPLEPYGRLPAELVMRPEDGKKLWACLTKKHPLPAEVILVQDDGDNRALSVACGIADTLRLDRGAIYQHANPEGNAKGPAPNQHVYEMVKRTRGMVV